MNTNLRPTDRIQVQCPQGHELYRDGVYVKTLFNNYGVRLARTQRVEDTSSYRLSAAQWEWMKHSCTECEKKKNKE